MNDSWFLGQSILSDYCAVYATGMLLSIAGRRTDRRDARRLFGARSGTWEGASHADIRAVLVSQLPGLTSRWVHVRAPDLLTVCGAFGRALERGAAALATAHCTHRRHRITCGHAFLITGITGQTIEVLDPLCHEPERGSQYNARISLAAQDTQTCIHVEHSPWDISLKSPVSLITVPVSWRNGP